VSLSTHASFYTASSLTERLFYFLCLLLPYIHKNVLQSATLIKSWSHACIRTQALFVNWRTGYHITSSSLRASLYHTRGLVYKPWIKYIPQITTGTPHIRYPLIRGIGGASDYFTAQIMYDLHSPSKLPPTVVCCDPWTSGLTNVRLRYHIRNM